MQLFVRALEGKTLAMNMQETDTVETLKYLVYNSKR